MTFSLNPFFRFDGYWVLADLLGVSDLSREGRRVLLVGWDRIRGRRPTPLPWPTWVVWVMSVHAVLSLAAMAWMLARMGPPLVAGLLAYPSVALRFAQLLRDPAKSPTGADVVALAQATISLLLGCAILWRLVSGLAIGAIRRLRGAPSKADGGSAGALVSAKASARPEDRKRVDPT